MWGAELFSAFTWECLLYEKSLVLPMHWTSPCGALKEASDYCAVSDYSMFVVWHISLIILSPDDSLFLNSLYRNNWSGPNSDHSNEMVIFNQSSHFLLECIRHMRGKQITMEYITAEPVFWEPFFSIAYKDTGSGHSNGLGLCLPGES